MKFSHVILPIDYKKQKHIGQFFYSSWNILKSYIITFYDHYNIVLSTNLKLYQEDDIDLGYNLKCVKTFLRKPFRKSNQLKSMKTLNSNIGK